MVINSCIRNCLTQVPEKFEICNCGHELGKDCSCLVKSNECLVIDWNLNDLFMEKIMDVTIVILTVAALQTFLFGLIADLIIKTRK